MTITLGIATYRQFDLCANAVKTAFEVSETPPDLVVVIDNSNGHAYNALQQLMDRYKYQLAVLPMQNIGWPAAQNWFLRHFSDYLIISNDDVEFSRNTISTLVEAAKTTPPDVAMIYPDCVGGTPWSLYLLKTHVKHSVGYFDDLFFPCYFDDNDYFYRMKLHGYTTRGVLGADYAHVHGGSRTIHTSQATLDAHHPKFRRNEALYILKWGGKPGNEHYTEPFNGVDPTPILEAFNKTPTW